MSSPSKANQKVRPSEIRTTEKYPTTVHEGSPSHPLCREVPVTHMKPVEQSFEWLLCALRFAAHNVLHDKWNKGVTSSYLKSCAVPDRVIDVMQKHVKNNAPTQDANAFNPADDPEYWIPYIWRSVVGISAWIDAGMHHIFHGVVARTMLAVEEAFTHDLKKTEFENLVNPHLLEIASLRLDWLHLKPLPKTQWLAEDELGFSRISVFAYGLFFANIKLRGNSNTSTGALLAMRQMIVAMWVMVALLMSPRDPVIELIDRHIKVFLSCCHRYSHLFYSADTVPFWATTSNFPSLLNLTAQIKKYGPIRWYWEGSRERYIQHVKKVLVSMRKTTSYFQRKLVFMQKMDTLEWLKENLNRKQGRVDYRRMYFRYESLEEIKSKFDNGEVLSGLTVIMGTDGVCLDSHYWIAYGKQGQNCSIVPVIVANNQDDQCKTVCGLTYHKHVLEENATIHGLNTQELRKRTSDYCLLLPHRENLESEFQHLHGVIFSDWDVIDANGNKNLPILCSREFRKNAMELQH